MLPNINVQTLNTSKCLNFSNQSLIENNIIIPDSKPNIKRIIRINSSVTHISAKALEGEVLLEGTICETLLYIGENAQLPFYSIRETEDFKESVIMPEITPAMKVFIRHEIAFTEETLLNERKINIKNVINFRIFAFSQRAYEVLVSSDDPNLQVLSGTISYSAPIDIIKETISISENIDLPATKPDVSELLTWDAYICNKDILSCNGQIQIKATLCLDALYSSDSQEDSPPEILNTTLPIRGFVEASEAMEGMSVLSELYPKNIYLRATENENGDNRLIEADISIATDIMLMENHNETPIQDAYSLANAVVTESESMEYINAMPTVCSTFTVSDSLTLDEGLPSIIQILKIWSYVSLEDSIIEKDKVIAEGDIRLEVLYVGTDDSQPLQVFTSSLPFSHEIEIPNANPGQSAYVTSATENTTFTVLNSRELEIRVSPVLYITLFESSEASFLTSIDETNELLAVPHLSSAVIYIVQPGDTLWDIAKRFGTTTDSLASLNNMENPDLIHEGDKLLITRTLSFK